MYEEVFLNQRCFSPRIVLTWWWLLHGASETWLIWYHTGRIIIRMPFYRWYLDCILQTCHRLVRYCYTPFCSYISINRAKVHRCDLEKFACLKHCLTFLNQWPPFVFLFEKSTDPLFSAKNSPLAVESLVVSSFIQVWCSLAHWRGVRVLSYNPS